MAQLVLLSSEIQPYAFRDDGIFPNNPHLPALFYEDCLQVPDDFTAAAAIEALFTSNGWTGIWESGIYNFHHYHSTSHEVLGVCSGEATVQLGGPHGITLEIRMGDVLIIPAGVAHCSLNTSADFSCIGAYPPGQEQYDVCRGDTSERPEADERIEHLQLPAIDPVYGADGPLRQYWLEWRLA